MLLLLLLIIIIIIIIIIITIIKIQMCEICKSLRWAPLAFSQTNTILHVLIHDEWHWHWQRVATLTLYNQENDKYSYLEQNITSFVVEIGIGIAQTKSHYGSCPYLMQFWFSFNLLFFLIIQSQAALLNCQYVERFTILYIQKHK